MDLRPILAGMAILFTVPTASFADQEAGNYPHVASGAYGRCYAKSVPDHLYDPADGPRQQGRTQVFQVGATEDELLHEFPWFSQSLLVRCGPTGDVIVVRLGPWHRGHAPREDHLAIAFYRGGELLRSYSTRDIADVAGARPDGGEMPENISVSVSHYQVFADTPRLVRTLTNDGSIFSEHWSVRAETVDGRTLRFNLETGALF